MNKYTRKNDSIPMASIIGLAVKSSAAKDTRDQKAPRDHRITETWGPNSEGEFVAWSAGSFGGEHIKANSPEALVARVWSLA